MPESPADTLRRAATLLRDRAMLQPHGPWHWEALGEGGYPQRVSNPEAIIVAETSTSPGAPAPACEYIAALHPTVVLRVADSWFALADEMADYPAVHVPLGIGIASRPEQPSTVWTHTYNAAVAYLGETP
jgi:hypothetical protein